MQQQLNEVFHWIENNQQTAIRLLKRLVQEDSTRMQEFKGQAVIIEKCRELGLELDIWEIGEETMCHPLFHSDRKDFSENPNVVATLKGSGGGKSLIVNSHIDVVPVGNMDDWQYEPFSGKIMDGKLYGRGATDMKGGTVALLYVLEALKECGIHLKGDVIFQSVIEEESGGSGTLAAVVRGYKADGALIPEPTNLKIFPKLQGSLWFRINVFGKSAHAGTRYEGVNAIEKSMKVINMLQQLETKRNETITDPLYKNIKIPVPINVGKFYSGKWPSSVPDLAIIEGRLGVKPDETIDEAMAELQSSLNELIVEDEWFQEKPPKLEWFGARWLPSTIAADHPLLTTVAESYQSIIGQKAIIEASPWATDGGMLYHAGGIPVVVFGPGITKLAHDSDEYILLEDIITAAKIIAKTVIHWCEISEK
ncbi:peptidase [Bacillus kwashiorkori]|uniref:peptidase n=1 Tax=Bacillus kwashiorkori TaxID=1522318 RepID=UPI0007802D5F